MSPIVNLNICDGLYERYLKIRDSLDRSQYREEPKGVIRFRWKTMGFVMDFWKSLGFSEPLLCYVFSNTPEYRAMLDLMRSDFSADFLGWVHVFNAETGEHYPLVSNNGGEPVLLAVHAKPFPQMEEKLLSVFDISDQETEDDEDGRECRTRSRDGRDEVQPKSVVHEDGRSRIASIRLDDSEEEFIRQIMEQERERQRKIKTALDGVRFHSTKPSKSINGRGGRK